MKRYVRLSEIEDSNSLVVNETTGYYVVKEEESAIFYSFCDAGCSIFFSLSLSLILALIAIILCLENITIELAIIHGVATNTSFSPPLFFWLADVVKQACSERHNVRVSNFI